MPESDPSPALTIGDVLAGYQIRWTDEDGEALPESQVADLYAAPVAESLVPPELWDMT